jgi:archaellum component FlaD/FlaE/archaellum component FlaC
MVLIDVAPVLPDLLPLGLVGVSMVSWLGDDGADEVDQDGGVEEDFEMDDGDDEFGMDDFDEDFDDLDGMDEGDEASSTELENRIEDLESEIADVSSTANTVRSENEQISEQVDEVEENVRKLLEIYEMVTRGVNPFVDDVSPEAGVGGGGDFGLFGDEGEESTEGDEDLESDIADAEAEEFFDDDAFDEEFGDEEFDGEEGEADLEAEFGGDDLDDADDDLEDGALDDGLEDDFEDAGTEKTMEENDTEDGGGTSFEELKAEYESGDADWAEEESPGAEEESLEPEESEGTTIEAADVEETPDDGLAAESQDDADLFKQDDLEGGDSSGPVSSDVETDTAAQPAEAAVTEAPESTTDSVDEGSEESLTEDAGFQFGAATAADPDQRPHLETPPNGYLADVLLMEWLSFLEGEFDARNAMRALNHYERIGWIGEATRDHCYAVLSGLTEGQSPYPDETGPTELSMDDHRRSLRYIEELATGHLDRELGERLSATSRDGIQR